jgi:hypothetical protein
MSSLDLHELRARLRYDPETGEFTTLARTDALGKHYKEKKAAGSPRKEDSRVTIRLNGNLYYRSRLAWFYAYGEWPTLEVDHIDRDPTNDRLSNLRLANRSENSTNRVGNWRKKVPCPRGVYKAPAGWVAQICKNTKSKYLGTFQTIEEAHRAYLQAAKGIHGEFLP